MTDTILIVDDEEGIRSSLAGILEDEGYRTVCAADGVEALAMCNKELPGLVLLDIWMPRMDGIETLKRLKELHPGLNVIMMSGHGTIETAVKSTKLGAYDFIEKPLSLEKVVVTVENALAMNRLKEENAALRDQVQQGHEMIGNSLAMLQLSEQIRLVARTNASVLITGENGTGKELVARSVHFHSLRRDKPFIEINCAAIPEELIESELFGHERGAFTGAVAQKKGKFDLADGGTLFLDEIGDVSQAVQAKLLRVIQEKDFIVLGSTRPRKVDVRFVAATNKDLMNEVRDGRFREDLYYRLNVISISLPPLRERRDDIEPLAMHFLDVSTRRMRKGVHGFDDTALRMLLQYDWPGNVRELENVIERAVILARSGTITANLLPLGNRKEAVAKTGSVPMVGLDEVERQHIVSVLKETGFNKSRTATILGISRKTLDRKINEYSLGDERVE